jgi:hypothetical protein
VKLFQYFLWVINDDKFGKIFPAIYISQYGYEQGHGLVFAKGAAVMGDIAVVKHAVARLAQTPFLTVKELLLTRQKLD